MDSFERFDNYIREVLTEFKEPQDSPQPREIDLDEHFDDALREKIRRFSLCSICNFDFSDYSTLDYPECIYGIRTMNLGIFIEDDKLEEQSKLFASIFDDLGIDATLEIKLIKKYEYNSKDNEPVIFEVLFSSYKYLISWSILKRT